MADGAPEGPSFDERQYDAKMKELTADGQDFASFDEVYETFDAMDLQEKLLRAIYAYGFEKRSSIKQSGIIPGLDVIQQAQSGTGKTATFSSGVRQKKKKTKKQTKIDLSVRSAADFSAET